MFCLVIFIYIYQISLLQVTVKELTTPLSRWVQVVWLFVQVLVICALSPTGLIPWFSNWGKYLSLLCCITLSSSREKPTQAQEVAGRISGAIAGEVLHQAYQVPIINSHLLHYIICHLTLSFLSPTSNMFSEKHKNICLFIRPLSVQSFVCLNSSLWVTLAWQKLMMVAWLLK